MGRKKALCIGCNYPGSRMKLNGCVNDAGDNVQFCIKTLGVSPSDMMVLTDEPCPGIKGASPPNKAQIVHCMQQLVQGARSGDILYFSFSGHGTQVPDQRGDEEDGMDEAIVPGDYERTKKVITDDELYAYLVEPLPEGCILHAVFDCCHSGTILDLDSCVDGTSGSKNKAGKKKYKKRDLSGCRDIDAVPRAIPPPDSYEPDPIPEPQCKTRGIGGPTVFCISGCRDDQTSLDVSVGGKSCGVLTNCIMESLNKGGNRLDYDSFFKDVLSNVNTMRSRMSSLTQFPQLSYSDAAAPQNTKLCTPPSGYAPAYPSPPAGLNPHSHGNEAHHHGGGYPGKDQKDKKEKKGGKEDKEKKEKKEKPPKAPKAAKEKKQKKGKSKDFKIGDDSDSTDSSDEEFRRKADAAKQILCAALGRF